MNQTEQMLRELHFPDSSTPPTAQINQQLVDALEKAEAALSDIGDAEREEGDDLAWCEERAAQDLPLIRAALAAAKGVPNATD